MDNLKMISEIEESDSKKPTKGSVRSWQSQLEEILLSEKMKSWCPSSGLLFLLVGMAVGNYNYDTYGQKPYSAPQPSATYSHGYSTDEGDETNYGSHYAHPLHHPLDPLSVFEMQFAGRIVTKYNSTFAWQFKFIGLREPDKIAMYPYFETRTTPPPNVIPRRANVIIADPASRRPTSVIVNLSSGKVEKWQDAKPGQKVAAITTEDNDMAQEIVLKHPAVKERLTEYGITDMSTVVVDTWDAGYLVDNPNYSNNNKIVQSFFYVTKMAGNNFYAHPLGIVVYVELGPHPKVRGIENLPIQHDFDRNNRKGDSVPMADSEYLASLLPANSIRKDLNALVMSQPDGPSFKVYGHEVTWENFNFRIGYNPREGFYLNTLTYNDYGKIRPLFYRLSMSGVYYSFGDPRPPYHRKSSSDLGNGEFGGMLKPLAVHKHCRGNAYYFQSDHHNEKAETWILQNSLCMVEEDDGVLWSHNDFTSSTSEVVRNQRLAITSVVTYGDADYIVSWHLCQDGTIELKIKLTGLLSPNMMAIDVKAPPYGNLMMPQVYVQNYQHFFAVRLDPDVDGRNNLVTVEDIVSASDMTGPENPYGNGIVVKPTVLATPEQAVTDNKPDRFWRISNPGKGYSELNGRPVSWKLMPCKVTLNKLTPDSPLIPNRIEWTQHNLWALPYDVDQIYAAGQFLDSGVAEWTRENEYTDITNTDLVLWHVFSYIQIPDYEDWPIWSGQGPVGFRLRPSNFFKKNPAVYAQRADEMTMLDESVSYGTASSETTPYGTTTYGADTYGAGSYGTGSYGADATETYGSGTYGTSDYGSGTYGAGSSGMKTYGTGSYGTGSYGADTTETYGSGTYGTGSYGTGSYGTGSYGADTTETYGSGTYGTGSYGTGSYGTGSYGTGSYGADATETYGSGTYGTGSYGTGSYGTPTSTNAAVTYY